VVREIKEATAVYVFKKIPTGNYATAVFQNVTSDGKINKNLVGVPKEPCGFSKNHCGMFGPPDVAGAAFDVAEDKSIPLTINRESFPKRSATAYLRFNPLGGPAACTRRSYFRSSR
jgi:uncharacterized protein (DUF2141 family)